MSQLIHELYLREIEPDMEERPFREEREKAHHNYLRADKEFMDSLSREQQSMAHTLESLHHDYLWRDNMDEFVKGFKCGARLVIEAINK